jgi:Dyp-type peroxidase family
VDDLEQQTEWLRGLCADGGVKILATNGKSGDEEYQAASAVFTEVSGIKLPTAKEHLGFSDGIGDPVFRGQYEPEVEAASMIGRGKRMTPDKGWEPIEPGEFILGHPDESQELPPTAVPPGFMLNGTFMAYRKLHENVGSFNAVIDDEARAFAAQRGISEVEARETLRAKMCGRWSDGVPLSVVPEFADWLAFGEQKGFNDPDPVKALENQLAYIRSREASDFRYADDMLGHKCPVGSHARRVNTRDYLDPLNKVGIDPETGRQYENAAATTALNKRRRILRRGLPYGPPVGASKDDDTEQGVAMITMCANLARQFEFVQQQWIQYGLDFHQGNDTCPLLGDHTRHKRFTITADPGSGRPPFVMSKLKTFVECRGGDYFFVPSMTALRMMAMGIVDPT